MARFDVFQNPDGNGFLLDVQANLLDGLNTRVVVPLLPASSAPLPARRLNPIFDIEAEPHVMVTQFMAAVPVTLLKAPVASLAGHDVEIGNALDMVFVGF
ncbi:CcdB-like toxin protein [uncultured Pleomorphomonas sp.]|uniref:Toxin CcdB n=1 Tax=uncultured Pleomorphomonas sp. TaxID=442121 RepID=A0A212LQB9_9HYPH|nr:CcdB family protein [uncultured Pleomorphomonas sp.]SCM79733.1 CcdB-like toxin protein [uncultured Pleomorphomonas sp.]